MSLREAVAALRAAGGSRVVDAEEPPEGGAFLPWTDALLDELSSEAEVELSRMDLEIRSILDRVVSPSGRSRESVLSLDLAILGRRPAGSTSEHHPLVQAAVAATSAVGASAELGLVVDDIVNEEDVLIKPLPSHMKRIGTLGGATISPDGTIIPILHVPDLEIRRREIVALIEGMLAHGVTPVVPDQGSVGASGDLAPLAPRTADRRSVKGRPPAPARRRQLMRGMADFLAEKAAEMTGGKPHPGRQPGKIMGLLRRCFNKVGKCGNLGLAPMPGNPLRHGHDQYPLQHLGRIRLAAGKTSAYHGDQTTK